MHDPRIGRFFAVDPLAPKYPDYSPYGFSGNKVIHAIELEGLEEFVAIKHDDHYVLVWDITARTRTGEKGTILYINSDNEVIEDMRKLTSTELGFKWVEKRVEIKGDDHRLTHSEKGTRNSLYRPSTMISGTDSKGKKYLGGESPAPLTFNQPPPPIKKPEVKTPKAGGHVKTPPPTSGGDFGPPPIVGGVSLEEGKKTSFDVNANFENWNSNITNGSAISGELDELADALKGDKTLHLWISGLGLGSDTDVNPSNPKQTSNMILFNRARAIRTELTNRGVNTDQITIGKPKTVGRRGVEMTVRNLGDK